MNLQFPMPIKYIFLLIIGILMIGILLAIFLCPNVI